MTDRIALRVHRITWEADGIVSLDLRRPDGGELPSFTAGAHIDTHLPGDLIRSYSLVNPQGERRRYVIAVALDKASRGGSMHMHRTVRAGEMLEVSPPKNNFPLEEAAPMTAMLAGGIGVTPMVSMAHRLGELPHLWQLTYCARTRTGAAFLHELESLASRSGGMVRTNFDQEPGGAMLDVAAWASAVPEDAHLYCCGPAPDARRVRASDRQAAQGAGACGVFLGQG